MEKSVKRREGGLKRAALGFHCTLWLPHAQGQKWEGPGGHPRPSSLERGQGRGLAALTAQHVVVGVIGHRVDVRRGLGAALPLVGRHHGGCVDREPFVGVDGDTEEAGVRLRSVSSG